MSERLTILEALESDWALTGIKKVWKYLPKLTDIPKSSFPCIHVAFGNETKMMNAEDTRIYEVPIFLIVFFNSATDVKNEGLLRDEAEDWIYKYKILNETNLTNLTAIEEVVSLEYITGTPYLNIEAENTGFLILEHKLTYMGA